MYTQTCGLYQLNQIFVYEMTAVQWAFLMLTFVEATAVDNEKVLNISLLRLSQESIIMRLSALKSQKT